MVRKWEVIPIRFKNRHDLVRYWDMQVKHFRNKRKHAETDEDWELFDNYLKESQLKAKHFRRYYRKRESEVGRFNS